MKKRILTGIISLLVVALNANVLAQGVGTEVHGRSISY